MKCRILSVGCGKDIQITTKNWSIDIYVLLSKTRFGVTVVSISGLQNQRDEGLRGGK